MPSVLHLDEVRDALSALFEARLDRDGPYGGYRGGPRKRADLYAACDVAWARALMGEDLKALPETQRREWIEHINSFAAWDNVTRSTDGSYFDSHGHSKLHANGMVIGALAVLGGKQKHPCRLYEPFDAPEKAGPWLETIDWVNQWSASHWFWGGMHCFSFSKRCPPGWLERVFGWLDAELDPATGWWRKGVPHADRHQPLGGSVHILPVYEHHGRAFPCPERVIDSVLALQLPNGQWLQRKDEFPLSYLELDALYAFAAMRTWAAAYRAADVRAAVERFADLAVAYWTHRREALFGMHLHHVLGAAGCFGLLGQLLPERFPASAPWTDIFSDKRFYDTAAVETFPASR
ncbi:MAG: hypothetical protein M5U26_08110 [Planctomycetota bacterium]|nr:hypothetical protein [Planctomycetota bacterium]